MTTEQERESERHVARVMSAAEFVAAYREAHRKPHIARAPSDLFNELELQALLVNREQP